MIPLLFSAVMAATGTLTITGTTRMEPCDRACQEKVDSIVREREILDCDQFQTFDSRFDCMTYKAIHDIDRRLKALESDTIGYWLNRYMDYNWCNTCSKPNEFGAGMCTLLACSGRQVVDTVWVMGIPPTQTEGRWEWPGGEK